VGGGRNPKPGEISLAHRGVLFMDEIAEFPGSVLEVLRQPLEDRKITVSRASGTTEFPAHFSLIAAMNPCPCGYYNVPESDRECSCSPQQIQKYQKKLSGPLLDRIDLHIDISPVEFDKLQNTETSESSVDILLRVQKARDIQTKRFNDFVNITSNSEMGPDEIKVFCELSDDSKMLLNHAVTQFGLSARSYHRILKVARSIADLELSEKVETHHVAEALQYRSKKSED
jgi:magnesium chelatase family protein